MPPLPNFQVLGQRFEIASRERDQLRDRFQASVKQAQQKSGFRNLILERKLAGLAEEAEKRDACVNEVRPSRRRLMPPPCRLELKTGGRLMLLPCLSSATAEPNLDTVFFAHSHNPKPLSCLTERREGTRRMKTQSRSVP